MVGIYITEEKARSASVTIGMRIVDWLIVFWFYAVSAIFQPCNVGDYLFR